MKDNGYRTISYPLHDVVTDSEERERIKDYVRVMEEHYHDILNDSNFTTDAIKNADKYKTEFASAMAKSLHKPYLDWKEPGRNAKMFRIMMSQFKGMLDSLIRRRNIAGICASMNWPEPTTVNMNTIRDKCSQYYDLMPRNTEIRNILASKSVPSLPDDMRFRLDYSLEDKELCERSLKTGNVYECSFLTGDEWHDVNLKLPPFIRAIHDNHVTAPCIEYRIDKNGNKQWFFIIRYEVKKLDMVKKDDKKPIMGVDLGKLNAFTAALLYPNGNISVMLLPSHELEYVNDKQLKRTAELNCLRGKITQNKKLLEPLDEDEKPELRAHLKNQKDKFDSLRGDISRCKDNISWLIARDVMELATDFHVCEIHMEALGKLLSDMGVGGRWEYSMILDRIRQLASINGIPVVEVNASGTSNIDPFKNEKLRHATHKQRVIKKTGKRVRKSILSKNRDEKLSDGTLIEHDYVSTLNLARLKSGSRADKARKLKKPAGFKGRPTPCRAKPAHRKNKPNIISKKINNSDANLNGSPFKPLPCASPVSPAHAADREVNSNEIIISS